MHVRERTRTGVHVRTFFTVSCLSGGRGGGAHGRGQRWHWSAASPNSRSSCGIRVCVCARGPPRVCVIVCARCCVGSEERFGEGAVRERERTRGDTLHRTRSPPLGVDSVHHAASQVLSRSQTSNWTWIPGCIWDISCSHELPDRGSLTTMYAVGLRGNQSEMWKDSLDLKIPVPNQ